MGASIMNLRRRLIRDSALAWPGVVLAVAALQAGAARADEPSDAGAPPAQVSGIDVRAPDKAAPKRPAETVQGLEVNAPRKVALPLLTEPVMETPQTITLITEQVMQLAGLSDLRDVLRLDPSVSEHADEDSGQGTNVQIRGFSARFDIYRDGQLDLGQYYRDPFDLETVEVLTGPSSVLFGRGSTGGAINDVSKKPMLDGHTGATLTVGDEGLGRLTGDVDAPLSATSAVRINGMADYSPTAGRDKVYTSRFGLSPVVGFGLGTPTEVTVGLMHQTQWGRPDYGVPWIDIAGSNVSHPASIPWGNYYGFKDDYARTNADIATVALKQDLAPGWTFNDQARYAFYSRNFRGVEPGVTPIVAAGTPLDEVTVTRTVRGLHSTESFLEDQAEVSGRFQLWGVTHKLVFGGEVGRQTSDPTTNSYSAVPGTNLISTDEDALFSGVTKVKSQVNFTADTAGAYVGDTIEYGRLFEAEGVVRIDRFAATFHNSVPTPLTLQETDTEPSYRAAFVYKPAPAGRIYVMYGTSFDPSAEGLSLSATTADLAPEREHTVEAGIKWEFNHRALLLSGAVFDTVQDNFREPLPTDPSLETIAGTARSRGVELEAQGRITPRWLVLAGYTYLDATIISSPNNDVGQPLQDAPRNSLRLFSAYDVTDRLTLGGGLDYSSSRVPSSTPDPNGFRQEVPGYTTLSVLARYQLRPDLGLQLNVDNLFDKHYYDGTDDNHVNVGAGRSVHLTLSFRQ